MNFSLPDELTGWIFDGLDTPSLLRCMQACKLFQSIILGTTRLVYKIELYACYMEDNEHSSLETVNRLNLLREYNRAWDDMDWMSYGTIPMTSRRCLEFSGGILAQSARGNKLSLAQLPCKLKGIPERTWSIPFDFRIRDFALDNSQNLIVLLELVGTAPNMSCNIHLRTLSGGQHPCAAVTQITYSLADLRLSQTFSVMHVCGDRVAVLFYAEPFTPSKNSFIVWNWRTGQQELFIRAAEFKSFAFMTVDLVLIGIVASDFEPGLQVLRVSPHVDSINPLEHSPYICEFQFPKIQGRTRYLMIRVEPTPTWKPSADSGVPFYASRRDSIFTISVGVIMNGQEEDVVFCVPLSNLLFQVERSHSTGIPHRIVSWNTWGPDGTRLLVTKPSETWTGYTYGMKFIQGPRRRGHVAQVYDFNSCALRKHAKTSVDTSSSVVWEHLAPQSTSTGLGIFEEQVVTRLPGRVASITLGHSDAGWDGVMIGEDHIVMVQPNSATYGYMAM